MNYNGQRTENSKGGEGGQEGASGYHLQQSPSATDGGDGGKEGHNILIHLENASQRRTLILQANTTAEVKTGIFRAVPSLNCPQIQIELFASPYGSKDRQPILGHLPKQKQLYATLFLVKH
jgi:hypothetical protein